MMRNLLLKIVYYCIATLLVFACVLYFYLLKYESYIDQNYARLTSYHNQGLIIGTSRSAIDLEPSILGGQLYNFSFTIDASPYDNSYMALIRKYHQNASFDKNRIHILTVDPWALSSIPGAENLINPSFTSKLKLEPMRPNFEYILRFANLSIWEISNVMMNSDRNLHINSFGRMIKPMTEEFLNKDYKRKLGVKIDNYKQSETYKKGKISANKLRNLEELIDYLKLDGKVYLIRLPIASEMLELEDTMCPEFNSLMLNISGKHKVTYIDIMPARNQFRTTDGHHMWENEIPKFNRYLRTVLDTLNYTNAVGKSDFIKP